MKTVTKTLHVSGMTCSACSSAVERGISRAEGVDKATVNLTTEKLTVEYDPEKIGIEDFDRIIDRLGYKLEKAQLEDITILVEGMT